MNYPGHLIFGFILGSIFILIMNNLLNWFSFGILNIILYILIIFLFSLLPDIDLKNSKITWIFFGIAIIGLIYGLWNQKFLIPSVIFIVITFLFAQLSHRGITHSFLAIFLFSLPIYLIFGLPEAFLSVVAIYSHLLGDGIFFKLW